VGSEALVAAAGIALGLFTWSHQQRQNVIDKRFESVKSRLEATERTLNELPKVYALKTDLESGLAEIKDRLNHINDKLDQLIMSKL
jgi:uncharacterized protein HemX